MRFVRLKEAGKIVTTPIIVGSKEVVEKARICDHEWRDMSPANVVPPGGGMDECVKCIAVRFTFIKSQWNNLVAQHNKVDFNKVTETLSEEEYKALSRETWNALDGDDNE